MTLRLASHNDWDDIKRLCADFHKASPYGDFPVDNDKVEVLIEKLLTDGQHISIILLANDDTHGTVGILAATTGEILFNREKLAQEILWWIDPEHRKSRHGLELLKAYEYWAHKIGCTAIQMSSLYDPARHTLDKLYTKRGFTQTEQAYIKVF
jgi:GNAT superfamily N-acetyltransferase